MLDLKKFLIILPVFLFIFISIFSQESPDIKELSKGIRQSGLIISEVCDPSDQYKGRFVEIYNAGQTTIDFSLETWYLSRQANGSTWADVLLEGILLPGECHIVAKNDDDFAGLYGFMPHQSSGIISGNGDDGYFLFEGGDHSTGILIDAYGVIDQDGTGEPWEYLDSKAVRKASVSIAGQTWTVAEWSLYSGAGIPLMTPGVHKADVCWNGSGSDDWNNYINWSFQGGEQFIPDVSCNVTLPSLALNQPVLTDTAFVNTLILYSDSLSSCSLLGHEKIFVDNMITIHKIFTGGNGVKDDDPGAVYHYISTVSGNQKAGDAFPASAFLRSWNEPLQEWHNLTAADSLQTGMGYSLYLPEGPDTITFMGNFVSGAVEPMILHTSGGTVNPDYEGYNLVGNPYPCCIDWDLGSWIKQDIDASIAVWSSDNGGYIYWNGVFGGLTDGIIPSGQGFFVKAGGAQPSLSIPMDARVDCDCPVLRENNYVPDLLTLEVQGENGYSDELYIHFSHAASWGYDHNADARKLFGLQMAPQLYSWDGEDNMLAINVIPPDNVYISVDVGFYTGYDGEFQLRASGVETFPAGVSVFLEDLLTGEMIDLFNQKSYMFSYMAGDDPRRFTIHFSGLTAVEDAVNHQDILVLDRKIYIGDVCGPVLVKLYDAQGKEVHTCMGYEKVIGINPEISPGCYILEVVAPKFHFASKVIFK